MAKPLVYHTLITTGDVLAVSHGVTVAVESLMAQMLLKNARDISHSTAAIDPSAILVTVAGVVEE